MKKLAVKRLPNGSRIVVFPGNEFTPEHFHPDNLKTVKNIRERVTIIEVKKQPFGIVRRQLLLMAKTRARDNRQLTRLTPLSEARLARFVMGLNMPNVVVEEPVAAHLHKNGDHVIFYRKIRFPYGKRKVELYFNRKPGEVDDIYRTLRANGIEPVDFQSSPITRSRLGIYDLETWRTTPELRKKLKLKYQKI